MHVVLNNKQCWEIRYSKGVHHISTARALNNSKTESAKVRVSNYMSSPKYTL